MMCLPIGFEGPMIPTYHGGLDGILLKRRKTSFGARKTTPGGDFHGEMRIRNYQPMTNKVEPYTAPNTMKKRKVK